MDPYNILNVSREATNSEIKKAYRKLAAKHHPDKGGDEEIFKQISEAYSLIETEEKRQLYERSQNPFGDIFGGFGDIFENFFGSNPASHRKQEKEQTDDQIVFDFKISLSQIKKGLNHKIVYSRNKKCPDCSGTGGEGKRLCSGCHGTGVQTIRSGNMIRQSVCGLCSGLGFMFEDKCATCKGHGIVRVNENVSFTVKQN